MKTIKASEIKPGMLILQYGQWMRVFVLNAPAYGKVRIQAKPLYSPRRQGGCGYWFALDDDVVVEG